MAADLHLHSTYSDGTDRPEELIKLASARGLTTVAIADHDTLKGIDEGIKAGLMHGVEVIPAVEISTFTGRAELHILGYYISYQDKDGDNHLTAKLKEIFKARILRAKRMVERLNDLGINISYQRVKELAGGDFVGRPHIARALIEEGYIKEMGEAFTEQYIGNESRAYVPKFKLTPAEGIKMILENGGIPILAHPAFINHGSPLTAGEISELVSAGLAGIEVYHSKHSVEQTDYYLNIALDSKILITGGSDYHGENSPGTELGEIMLDNKYVAQLKKYRETACRP